MLTGTPKRVSTNNVNGASTCSQFTPPGGGGKAASRPWAGSPSLTIQPQIATTTSTEPVNSQSSHQGRWALDARKVPKVWMESLDTTE